MHTHSKILALSCLLVTSICSADNFIGQTIPPYTNGWEEEGGACIEADCKYNLSVLKKDDQRLFYFGEKTNAEDNPPHWLVLDQMPYPEAPANFSVQYASCQINGKADPSIIAVVKATDTEWYDQVRFAYQANTATEQFETISIKGIRCENAGWGV